jgi:L-alanine-DL-glutamate epimerase-like enolase superfamily enzyme
MKTNRRRFITTSLAGSLAATMPMSACAFQDAESANTYYAGLDKILKQPVLKKGMFIAPVIIETLELLRYNDSFLCRVRSKDGAEGISVSDNSQMKSFYPVFVNRLQTFFIGKDARDLESLIEEVYVYQSNYKFQSLALWIPVATIEFAILDMLGRITDKSMGQLIGNIHNPFVSFYQANSERDISSEETLDHLHKQLAESKARAIKIKVGGRMSHPEFPADRTEKLIPMVRRIFGDDMHLYADSNGSYTAEEAIRIGKLLQEYKFEHYEEPVPFDWYEETKQVADALAIPIAGGEQEASLHNFRWLIANDALQIVQPDVYYFGGLIRSVKVARMAEICGKICTPHVTSGLGYLYMMHFISSISNARPYHEFKGYSKEIPFECKTSTLLSDEGNIKVPTGPGSGIDIDPDFIKKHEAVKE